MTLGDNEYRVRVYRDDKNEANVTALQRAFHGELCRIGVHAEPGFQSCYRAFRVWQRWASDGEPVSWASADADKAGP